MSTESSFQSDNLGWQIQKLGQQIQEWIEYQLGLLNWSEPTAEPMIWPEWIGQSIFWVLVIGFSIWLIWQIYQILQPYVVGWRSPLAAKQKTKSTRPLERSTQSWWQHAQALQRQRRFKEACLALYMGMLQQLHDKKLIPQKDSYTDGEYWSILQNIAIADASKVLLNAHEEITFGNMSVSEELFNRCQQAYREIASP